MTSLVDPKEIAKFNKIARNYWDPEGPMRAIHKINPLRIDFTESCYPLQDASVLDVGCGGGMAAEAMARRGSLVTAIDASEAMIKTAKLHAAESGLSINYLETHAEQFLQMSTKQFDVVTCFEMVEHVPDPHHTLTALSQLVRPGGWLILSTINKTPKAYLGAVIAAEYILKWVPRGTHDYTRFLRPSDIAASLRPAGLEIEYIEGLTYQPLYQQFKRTIDDITINYQLGARKVHGETY